MSNEIDLDKIVDYKAEYLAVIKSPTINGDTLSGLCPFHKDNNPSFSVSLKTGQWICHAEGISGNFISFVARLNGIDNKEAYKQILRKYNVDAPAAKSRTTDKKTVGDYTLDNYAFDKHLPADWLREEFGLSTARERNGTKYLRIPYFDSEGREIFYRKRFANKEFRWPRGTKAKTGLYNVHRLQWIKQSGWVILVEGESDTQALTFLGLPALGIPGANMFQPEHKMLLEGLKIYIHQEPDKGGTTFREKLVGALHATRFDGPVYVWSCQEATGLKDPSDVYLTHGKERATTLIRDALKRARELDLEAEMQKGGLTAAPIALRTPPGWAVTDKGVSALEKKTLEMVLVCRTPILITKRIKSLDSGLEKIEVAFRQDGEWVHTIQPRSVVFDAQKIRVLSDLGASISSENAKGVVSWLSALEAENYGEIPLAESAAVLGWQPGRRFLPGYGENIVLDIDPSQRAMVDAYCKAGTFEGWVGAMSPHRVRSRFRFILAASFAAPLLRILKQRIFFVYNWGGSKGGKTAALKAALSAWGDPDRLMVNFNSTQVGLERTAALYCDLPLGIDERQLAGTAQGSLEKTVYMIAAGAGKLRGAKNGGIQAVQQWRTVAIATGEEPLSTDTSQTGVSTRTLEIYGGPFEDETSASLMHQQAAENYGHAGPAYIGALLQMSEEEIRADYDRIHGYIQDVSQGKNGAHIAGISAVALADSYIGAWLFGQSREDAEQGALAMAAEILTTQVEVNATDVNETAVQAVADWVLSNFDSFGEGHINGPRYGYTDNAGETIYIYPSVLNQALEKAGFSVRKTMRYMADRGLIGTATEKGGKKKYSVTKRLGGHLARFVELYLNKVVSEEDGTDTAPAAGAPWAETSAPVPFDGAEPLPF